MFRLDHIAVRLKVGGNCECAHGTNAMQCDSSSNLDQDWSYLRLQVWRSGVQ